MRVRRLCGMGGLGSDSAAKGLWEVRTHGDILIRLEQCLTIFASRIWWLEQSGFGSSRPGCCSRDPLEMVTVDRSEDAVDSAMDFQSDGR